MNKNKKFKNMKEINKYNSLKENFNNIKLVNTLKNNKKLFGTLIRIQARIRGLISRKKTRSMNINSNTRFPKIDSNSKYFFSNTTKIVY